MPHNHLPDHQSIAIARTKFEDNLEGHLISNFLSLAAKAGKKLISCNCMSLTLNFYCVITSYKQTGIFKTIRK